MPIWCRIAKSKLRFGSNDPRRRLPLRHAESLPSHVSGKLVIKPAKGWKIKVINAYKSGKMAKMKNKSKVPSDTTAIQALMKKKQRQSSSKHTFTWSCNSAKGSVARQPSANHMLKRHSHAAPLCI